MQYDIQYIKVEVSEEDIGKILAALKRKRLNKKRNQGLSCEMSLPSKKLRSTCDHRGTSTYSSFFVNISDSTDKKNKEKCKNYYMKNQEKRKAYIKSYRNLK